MAKKPNNQLNAPRRRQPGPGGRKRRFGAFTAVLILLAITIGGLVIAMALSYEPPADLKKKNVDIAQGKTKNVNGQDKKKTLVKETNGKSTAGKKLPDNSKATNNSNKTATKTKTTGDKLPVDGKNMEKNSAKSKKSPDTTTRTDTPLPDKIVLAGPLKAPVMDIHDRGKKGLIPKIAVDGRRALQVYAGKHKAKSGPMIAMVISNLGANASALATAIKDLPPEFSLAFSPYAKNLQVNVDAARAAGHEILIEVPMEPLGYPDDDPGPLAMLTGLPARINVDRLEWTMGKFAGYIGTISKMGGRFGNSKPSLRPILQRIHDAGLMFVDNRNSNTSVPMMLADKIGLPRAYVDRLIDRSPNRTDIENRLAELETIAKAQGAAVGRGFAYPVTIERLVVWTQRLSQSDISLVPMSAVAGKQPVVK